MATKATRTTRAPLPALLVLLLALLAGGHTRPVTGASSGRPVTAVATTGVTSAAADPVSPAPPVRAVPGEIPRGRERVLRQQTTTGVHAARAPPAGQL